ncbi:MAG TPA: glycosyltransferase, partial [Bacteroidetes bacterium]|nr:glycosyltransferase [Bacteroidota bacterium]
GVLGWASLIISIWFLSGVIIFVLGIVGIYIGRIFDQIKQRPLYIIKQTIN